MSSEALTGFKDDFKEELLSLKAYGKIILGKEISDKLIENWSKGKLYYTNKNFNFTAKSQQVKLMKSTLTKLKAKAFLFDKDCEDSQRILIQSGDSLSKFKDSNVNSNSKTKFIKLLQDVFHDMGEKYTPVNITSDIEQIKSKLKSWLKC
ncbi:MAG: hypothetical protein ACRCV0_04505 [Brevinema sp.]